MNYTFFFVSLYSQPRPFCIVWVFSIVQQTHVIFRFTHASHFVPEIASLIHRPVATNNRIHDYTASFIGFFFLNKEYSHYLIDYWIGWTHYRNIFLKRKFNYRRLTKHESFRQVTWNRLGILKSKFCKHWLG